MRTAVAVQSSFSKLQKSSFNRGRTDRIDLTHDLDLQSPASYGHGLHAKVQGQRLVGSEDKVETNGRTDERTDGQTDGRRRMHYLSR